MNFEFFAQEAHQILNICDLKNLIITSLRSIFNHEMAVCVVGDLKSRRVIRLINIDFPDNYLNYAVHPDQSIHSYLIHKWIEGQQPIYFCADNPNANVDKLWLNVLKRCKIQTLASHGVVDPCNHYFSYFEFANVDISDSDEIHSNLINFIPYLHYALSRVLTLKQNTINLNLPLESVISFEDKKTFPLVSPREREILNWISLGKRNEEIAQILGISQHTVNNHIKSLFKRLDVTSRAQAVSKAASLSLSLEQLA